MKKRSGIAPLIAIGGILLALSVGSFFLTPDRAFSENENRYLQLTPRLTWDRIMSGDFMEDVEDYTSDQIVFRDFWTAARSVLQRAEGKEDISGTYLGADGRYFAKVTDDSFDWVRLEKNAGYIRDFFAASGKPCTALIVPGRYSEGYAAGERAVFQRGQGLRPAGRYSGQHAAGQPGNAIGGGRSLLPHGPPLDDHGRAGGLYTVGTDHGAHRPQL